MNARKILKIIFGYALSLLRLANLHFLLICTYLAMDMDIRGELSSPEAWFYSMAGATEMRVHRVP